MNGNSIRMFTDGMMEDLELQSILFQVDENKYKYSEVSRRETLNLNNRLERRKHDN